jgi:hypothetical protein
VTGKPLDLPPAVARAFVEDMKAFFAEGDALAWLFEELFSFGFCL